MRTFLNKNPSVQFKVDMSSDNPVTVDKKTQRLIIDILERDYIRTQVSEVNKKKAKKKARSNEKENYILESFASDSDSNCLLMKHIRNKDQAIEEHDFSFNRYRTHKSLKRSCLQSLGQ